MNMNNVIVIATIVSSLATAAIAWLSWSTLQLSKVIKTRDENYQKQLAEKEDEHRKEIRDLYEAIVIATIISGPSSFGQFEDAKNAFMQTYKGTTRIFKDR